MKNKFKFLGLIALVAVIAFMGCEDFFNDGDDEDNRIRFPIELVGTDWNSGMVSTVWSRTDGDKTFAVIFTNTSTDYGDGRSSFSWSEKESGNTNFHLYYGRLTARNGNTFTITDYYHSNESENVTFSFTAVVGSDDKVTISDAKLVSGSLSTEPSLKHPANISAINGTYEK